MCHKVNLHTVWFFVPRFHLIFICCINLGDRRHFKKKDITPSYLEGKEVDVRYIHIPLIMAERAWAYAMQVNII